jgi:hypothetical protein
VALKYLPPVFSARHDTAAPLLVVEPEAHDMSGEVDAGSLELGGERARIGLAALDAVGDEDHRRLVLGVARSSAASRTASEIGVLPSGVMPSAAFADRVGGAGLRLDQKLDVAALALRAVP